MTFKAFKELIVRFLFENHETIKLYSCNLKYLAASRYILTLPDLSSLLNTTLSKEGGGGTPTNS